MEQYYHETNTDNTQIRQRGRDFYEDNRLTDTIQGHKKDYTAGSRPFISEEIDRAKAEGSSQLRMERTT